MKTAKLVEVSRKPWAIVTRAHDGAARAAGSPEHCARYCRDNDCLQLCELVTYEANGLTCSEVSGISG